MASGCRAGQLHAGEVDRNVESDVEVVGEEIERDLRHDLDNLLVIEADVTQFDNVGGRHMSARVDDLDGEGECRGSLRVGRAACLSFSHLLRCRAGLATKTRMGGEAVVAVVAVGDGDRDLFAELRAELAAAERAERALSEVGREAEVLWSAARSLTHILEQAEDEMLSKPLEEWSQDYAQHLPTMRLASEWAFSGSNDDVNAAVKLVVSALPLLFRLTLMEESPFWALKAISTDAAREGDARRRMKLHAALGWPAMRSTSRSDKGLEDWTKVLAMAEKVGDNDFQLRATWAFWVDAITSSEPRKAMKFAEQFSSLAGMSADPMDAAVGKRMVATALHWLGRHAEARDLLLVMLGDLEHATMTTASGRYHLDQGATARITLARCHWILGDRNVAFATIERAVNDTLAIKHEVSLTHVLAEAGCPLALLDERLDLAKEYASLLLDHTESLSLDLWQTYARCFEAEIAITEGRAWDGVPRLCAELTSLQRSGFNNFRSSFVLAEAKGLAQLGRYDDALAILDDTITSCRDTGERWCLPELLRVKASVVLENAKPSAANIAAECFRMALDEARADGALEWERRIIADIGRDEGGTSHLTVTERGTETSNPAEPRRLLVH